MLCCAGADLHARDEANGPTPLSLAQAQRASSTAADGSPADLVLRAAQPWAPATHDLFPTASRARAVAVLWPLYGVAWRRLNGGGMNGVDFAHLVMSFDVLRV